MFNFEQTDVYALRCALPVFDNTVYRRSRPMNDARASPILNVSRISNSSSKRCVSSRHSFVYPSKRHKPNPTNHCLLPQPIAAQDHLIECIIQCSKRHQQTHNEYSPCITTSIPSTSINYTADAPASNRRHRFCGVNVSNVVNRSGVALTNVIAADRRHYGSYDQTRYSHESQSVLPYDTTLDWFPETDDYKEESPCVCI
eukprot:19962_1